MSELHSSLVNQEKLSANVMTVFGCPASSSSLLFTTPSTESASISFRAVGREHRSRSTTSDVLSVPPFSIKCRKILARLGGELSNVISSTGHKSSAASCRRPQINACALARLANRQFIRSGFSITGTEWESFSSPSVVSSRYTFMAPRSEANRRAQRAITRRQLSGSFSLS